MGCYTSLDASPDPSYRDPQTYLEAPMRLARPSLALAAALAAVVLSANPAAAAGPIPNSMASMGDSITRGFNACATR